MGQSGIIFATLTGAVFGCRGPGVGDEKDLSATLFDETEVRRIDVRIPRDNGPPSSWDLIDSESRAPGCVAFSRSYREGGVEFVGQSLSGVGIRVKGGCGSSSSLDEKPGLKIHLSWDENPEDEVCPADRRIRGLKRLTLNNGRQDSTALHEHLSYKFYRMVGVPAPRTASVQLYLNDEYYGIYQFIETIDRQFLKRNFNEDSGKGMMYEGSYHCDLLTGDDAEPSEGSCWEPEFELDNCSDPPAAGDDLQFEEDGVTPQDPWVLLREFRDAVRAIQGRDAYYPAITALVDWDEFLANWAASSVLYDWDNYAQFQNNFRIYHNPRDGLWHFIPWGVDQSWIDSQPGDDERIRFGILDPTGDLARLCLTATGTDTQGRTCTQAYVQELHRQIDLFASVDWDGEIDTWAQRLDPLMDQDDPHRSYSYEDWLGNVERLRNFARDRAENVRSELARAGFPAP